LSMRRALYYGLEKMTGQTDGRTPDPYITLTAIGGQRKKD